MLSTQIFARHVAVRVCKQYTTDSNHNTLKTFYDAVIVGGGHNGLVAAAYLQKAGLNVCVLERRYLIGGAAVTEEILPGFKFSRASYVLSLLRPQIVKDLELKKHGLKVYLRNPSSYTPLLEPGGKDGKAHSLCLGTNMEQNKKQISKFSDRDAQAYVEYEKLLKRIVLAMDVLLDSPPVPWASLTTSSIRAKWQALPAIQALISTVLKIGQDMPAFYELMTAPAQKVLNRWFESEPLRATLATDSVVGSMTSPLISGSAYVLLHHVMGELEGIRGIWGYVEGGMGGVSQAIAKCAVSHGADVFCNKPVKHISLQENHATGVVLEDGTEVKARVVLSNATPKVTYLSLVPQNVLPEEVVKSLKQYDSTSPVTKINVALDRIPSFTADPNLHNNELMPHHQCSIHLNCENIQMIHEAFLDAQKGLLPSRPMIEMVIPSSLDPTLAPPGKHVASLFTQFTPYTLANGGQWDDETRNKYASLVFDTVENYAPGFKSSIIGCDVLTPPDLENIFGLTGGNIFHGTMSLDQLYISRPVPSLANYRGPITGLYLCGSGSHPGGGVMGSAGRLAAQAALTDISRLKK